MIIVRHRINRSEELKSVLPEFGVEVDLRSRGGDLIIHHDPFQNGENFLDWIKGYRHRLLILNVKEEGLESRLLSIMAENSITDFFFLDQSFPFLIKTARSGENRTAVRVSEYESLETALRLKGMVRWLWLDCFSGFSVSPEEYLELQKHFAVCIVSPELQGRFDDAEILEFKQIFKSVNAWPAAVCTKFPEKWR